MKLEKAVKFFLKKFDHFNRFHILNIFIILITFMIDPDHFDYFNRFDYFLVI